jgi:hypothetical protein
MVRAWLGRSSHFASLGRTSRVSGVDVMSPPKITSRALSPCKVSAASSITQGPSIAAVFNWTPFVGGTAILASWLIVAAAAREQQSARRGYSGMAVPWRAHSPRSVLPSSWSLRSSDEALSGSNSSTNVILLLPGFGDRELDR